MNALNIRSMWSPELGSQVETLDTRSAWMLDGYSKKYGCDDCDWLQWHGVLHCTVILI